MLLSSLLLSSCPSSSLLLLLRDGAMVVSFVAAVVIIIVVAVAAAVVVERLFVDACCLLLLLLLYLHCGHALVRETHFSPQFYSLWAETALFLRLCLWAHRAFFDCKLTPLSMSTLRKRNVGEEQSQAAAPTHGHSHGGVPCHGHSHSHSHASSGSNAAAEVQEFLLSLSTPTFLLHIAVRIVGAVLVPISDCDEVYNYWEPLHYLLYGSGMQTWEYSPEFALRSYGYLRLAGFAATWPAYFGIDKIIVFYFLRLAFAFIALYAEHFFLQSIRKRYGESVHNFATWAMLASFGMCVTTSSVLLPNSAAMVTGMVTFGFWMRGYRQIALLISAFTVIVISPFVAVVFLPMVLNILITDGLAAAVFSGLKAILFILIPSAIVDYWFYGSPVVSAWNIAEYNAFANEERGAELYGVEPWTYVFVAVLFCCCHHCKCMTRHIDSI